jgi:murein DD-endopeptidase MepM/ murein hydrolase activator NlpD
VAQGDTLQSIAQRYGVPVADIVQFPLNRISATGVLAPGQKLVIPGGRLDYADRIAAPGRASGYALAWPMRGELSQGYRSGHLAIDIASVYGAKVHASRGGRVTYARFSPDGWLGFRVIIVHDGGLTTSYSHLSGITVEEGEVVARGQVIGQLGSTGNSTGPHVHFEVWQGKAKVNPLSLMPAAPD